MDSGEESDAEKTGKEQNGDFVDGNGKTTDSMTTNGLQGDSGHDADIVGEENMEDGDGDIPGQHGDLNLDPSGGETPRTEGEGKVETNGDSSFVVTGRSEDSEDRDTSIPEETVRKNLTEAEALSSSPEAEKSDEDSVILVDSLHSHDVINNNHMAPDKEQQAEGAIDSNEAKISNEEAVGAINSTEEGYVGMEGFPGQEQSEEILRREADGKEEEEEENDYLEEEEDDLDDVEKLLGDDDGSTDTSHLAQLIVDHVIGNVVTSFNVDESSSATEKDIEEAMKNSSLNTSGSNDTLEGEGRGNTEQREGEGQVVENGLSEQDEENQRRSSEFVETAGEMLGAEGVHAEGQKLTEGDDNDIEKREAKQEESATGYGDNVDNQRVSGLSLGDANNVQEMAAPVPGDADDASQVEALRDDIHQTSEPEYDQKMAAPNGEEKVETVTATVDVSKGVRREESIDMSDTECGSMGRLPKLEPLPGYPDFPQNYGNYKVCRPVAPGVKECIILETGECILCKKTKESGKTVVTCTHRYTVINEEDVEADQHVAEKPFVEDSSNKGQTVAEILQSMNLEIIDVQATGTSSPAEGSGSLNSSMDSEKKRSFHIPRGNDKEGGVAYMTMSSAESSSPRAQISENHRPLRESETSPGVSMNVPRDHISEASPLKSTSNDAEWRKREEEMLREQMILEKVRRDMAQKEREMRARLEGREGPREAYPRESELSTILYTSQDTTCDFYPQEDIRHRRIEEIPTHPSRSAPEVPVSSKYQDHMTAGGSHHEVSSRSRASPEMRQDQRTNRYTSPSRDSRDHSGEVYARLHKVSDKDHGDIHSSHSKVRPSKDDLRTLKQTVDSLAEGDVTESDRAILSELYSRYNIPPPQYSISMSLRDDSGSSRISTDLEAPPPKSGTVPAFKTLQEQQVGWMRMFKTLEEQHQQELGNQYRQHQESIFRLQQQMEDELFHQQQSLKKKLAAHKEVLNVSSGSSRSQSSRMEEDSELLSTSQMLGPYTDNIADRESGIDTSPESAPQSGRSRSYRRSPTHTRVGRSPPWRDIYREIRGKGIDSDDTETEESLCQRADAEQLTSRSGSEVYTRTAEGRVASPRSPGRQSALPRAGVFSSPMPLLRKDNSSKQSPVRQMSLRMAMRTDSPGNSFAEQKSRESVRSHREVTPEVHRHHQDLQRSNIEQERSSRESGRVLREQEMSFAETERSYRELERSTRELERSYRESVRSQEEQERSFRESQRSPREQNRSHRRERSKSPRDLERSNMEGDRSFRESQRSVRKEVDEVRLPLDRSRQEEGQGRSPQPDQRDISRLKLREETSSPSVLELSPRSHLREKHARHLADLREYYEAELQGLREALSSSEDTGASYSVLVNENQTLVSENRSLRKHKEEAEAEIEAVRRKLRERDQQIHGLEKRAAVYADHYKEAQEKISAFRNMVEELQYTDTQQRDMIEQLQYQIQNQTDTIKQLKKVQGEQMEVIQQDRNAFNKISDKYEALERDFNILKETLNSSENNLHDARKEIVELNRMLSKMELESKRLGRENDNLRFQATQHINTSLMNSSLTDSHDVRTPKPQHQDSPPPKKPPRLPEKAEFSPPCRDRSEGRSRLGGTVTNQEAESATAAQRPKSSTRQPSQGEEKRTTSVPLDLDDMSPVMRAEKELLRLREIMRQTDNMDSTPVAPKLQKKKYYGSEVASSRSSSSSVSSPKIRKKKSPVTSPNSKTSSSRMSDRSDKSKELLKSLEPANSGRSPQRSKFEVNPAKYKSLTRFDLSGNDRDQVVNGRSPGDGRQSREGTKASQTPNGLQDSKQGAYRSRKAKKSPGSFKGEDVDEAIEKVKSGEIIARPGWENVHTSMAKPSTPDAKPVVKPQTAKQRMESIQEMEQRYDNLQTEKNKLEAALSRVPLHGKGRKEKEDLENQLDSVEKELGSVRMSLKRYHVLKSSI